MERLPLMGDVFCQIFQCPKLIQSVPKRVEHVFAPILLVSSCEGPLVAEEPFSLFVHRQVAETQGVIEQSEQDSCHHAIIMSIEIFIRWH